MNRNWNLWRKSTARTRSTSKTLRRLCRTRTRRLTTWSSRRRMRILPPRWSPMLLLEVDSVMSLVDWSMCQPKLETCLTIRWMQRSNQRNRRNSLLMQILRRIVAIPYKCLKMKISRASSRKACNKSMQLRCIKIARDQQMISINSSISMTWWVSERTKWFKEITTPIIHLGVRSRKITTTMAMSWIIFRMKIYTPMK